MFLIIGTLINLLPALLTGLKKSDSIYSKNIFLTSASILF